MAKAHMKSKKGNDNTSDTDTSDTSTSESTDLTSTIVSLESDLYMESLFGF